MAFSGKQPVKMRSICLVVFVLICGCIHHLLANNQTFKGGILVIADLYREGANGTSGGVLCGSIAMLVRWLCGGIISAIIFGLGAVFTLLAAMKITVPSIIRAIKNRPRDDWDEEEYEEEDIEPAAMVVNHIANRRIEHNRQRRQRIEENQRREDDIVLIEALAHPRTEKNNNQVKKTNWMDQIGGEIEEPVAAAAAPVKEDQVDRPIVVETKETKKTRKPRQAVQETQESGPMPEEDNIPVDMPAFRADDPIPDAPKMESSPAPTAAAAPGKVTSKDAAESAQQVAAEIAQTQAAQKPVYCFPPIDLLEKPSGGGVDGTAEMRENSRRLNETLASFKIDAHIVNVTRGPSVTRYEVELDKGVRLSKLTSCADDIALSLGASGVRIAAVPGRISVVGIEVPNKAVTTVHLREVIDSPEFCRSKSKSSFSVGKDIGGNCIVGNIRKMPHMLIAGTTGSGKSVCMNSIIISLLYKASPEDVKLIMVDPKMVELGIYNGIPHLLIPVVTDPKKAAGSLQWAVTEMLRRYKMMSDAGVRDLESYNSIMENQEDGEGKLPQVVIIVDELADLMLVAAKEVEDSICRIAQMGRAAGMHLIIATQRPSADVITGLMKANIPSRIAFSVASAMESRIILDTQGAEKLVGKGDMLYAPIGIGKPQRVQGCFVTDSEVEAVANYVKENYIANYDQSVMEEIEKKSVQTGKKAASAADPEPNADELDGDEMLPAAVDVILETGQASVSMLQRRLKLGYARAARIVDEMEEKGIVGPFQGSKPRAILITKEQWQSMKSGGNAQMDFDDIPFDDAVPEEID
ncbi:MAG: DNA translocase FtsK [Oscillospiraceae bacterium]|nr:DNA translocase FtsK [Oscillospiraceae bacterium]